MNASPAAGRTVLVCQNRTCRRQHSDRILAALRTYAIPGTTVEACGCLGQCGNGPMVLVLPEGVWYSHLSPGEVPALVEEHLIAGKPVGPLLYNKFHPWRSL